MQTLRNAVGAVFLFVYFLAGGTETSATATCNESQYCVSPGVMRYEYNCNWSNEPGSCWEWWQSINYMCGSGPYYGWVSGWECEDQHDNPAICPYYPGLCRSSGMAQCAAEVAGAEACQP
jgi:hypothetical protein